MGAIECITSSTGVRVPAALECQARPAGYTGHGANTGGLQRHSLGEHYPYTVIRKGARYEWFCAFDMRTGKEGYLRSRYQAAAQDITNLKIRNMMHS